MSDYCNCCSSNTEHIRQHYDPDGLTPINSDPAEMLELFREINDGGESECPLTLADVERYIDEIAREAASC